MTINATRLTTALASKPAVNYLAVNGAAVLILQQFAVLTANTAALMVIVVQEDVVTPVGMIDSFMMIIKS